MSDYCQACEELKAYNAGFLMNGITDRACESLRRNEGLNPDLPELHDDCEDLHSVVDCLIGQLGESLPAYDICDVMEYLKKLMPNLYNTLKAFACSECGQWDAIEALLRDDFTELEAGKDYTWNYHSGLGTVDTRETYITLSVFESHDRYYFRVEGELFAPDLKQLQQEHNFGLDLEPDSLLITINFIGDDFGWINTKPENIVEHENKGSGIFNTHPKSMRCTWNADYNMAVNHKGNLVNIFWRSYNDGFNQQVDDTYYPPAGAPIILDPGILNYEFVVMKPTD